MAEATSKCIGCGLLAIVPAAANLRSKDRIFEVSPETRADLRGALSVALGERSSANQPAAIICMLRCPDFGETIDGGYAHSVPAVVGERLSREHGCGEWIKYTPGLSPKEHWERQQMINWREMEAAAVARDKRAEKRARKRERRMEHAGRQRELKIVIVLALAQLAAAALVAYLTAGPGSIAHDRLIKPPEITPSPKTPAQFQAPRPRE